MNSVSWAAQTTYVDATAASGLTNLHDPAPGHPAHEMLPGAAVGDFNNDSWPDLYVVTGGHIPDRLFINQGNGTFVDQAASWGLTEQIYGAGACVGDFDRDGWQDLYVVSGGDTVVGAAINANRLYRNNGNGTFSNVAFAAGVDAGAGVIRSKTAAWCDFDHDGWLDLLVTGNDTTSTVNLLYHNNQDGTFTEVTSLVGLSLDTVFGLTCTVTDFDGDRWPEIVAGGDFGTSKYYINNRNGTFTESTSTVQDLDEPNTMGFATADYDRDGDIDMHVSDIHWPLTNIKGSRLFVNQGNHVFTEEGTAAGVNAAGWAWGNIATDIDNNGWQDIISTNGWLQPQWQNFPTKLFYNMGTSTGSLQFTELSFFCGLIYFGNGRGMVRWDPDQDGDEDLLITGWNEGLIYFENELNSSNAWLQVTLDTSSHPGLAPHGIGTTMVAKVGNEEWVRQLDSSISHLSQHELMVHFGFGPQVSQVDELRIQWADGFDTVLSNVPVNQRIEVSASPPFSGTNPLVRGASATLQVEGAQAGERAWFLYSLVGAGPSNPIGPLGGLRLGILEPFRIFTNASLPVNASGTATLQGVVPLTAPLVTIYCQTVIRRGVTGDRSALSNVLSLLIQ